MPNWYRRVLLLSLPLILSNLTQPLLSTVDTILSGHLPGPSALGGVALSGILFNGIFWTFSFLRMATTGLIAQAHGAETAAETAAESTPAAPTNAALHHFTRALLTALLIGAAILLLQQPLINAALTLLGATGEVRQNAQLYCHIRIWSAPAALANYVILGYLLGRQQARMAFLLQAAINLVNVAVAVALVVPSIFGLHQGVAGIATATLAAETLGCLLGLALILVGPANLRLPLFESRWHILLDRPSLRRLLALNRDILLRTLSLVAAYGFFTRTGAQAGPAILAANAVLLNFHMIAAYALDGFANATEALVGQAIGAQRQQDYRSILRASLTLALAVAIAISLAYLALGHPIINLFTNQEPIRTLAAHYLPWVIAMPVLSVWSFELDGIFIGATRAAELRDSMLLSFLGFLALALLLTPIYGNHGLWAALLAFMVLRALTLGLRLPSIERNLFPAHHNKVD